MSRLSSDEIQTALLNLPDWRIEGRSIQKEFRFRTFRAAMSFVNEVAGIASEARHHPDILIRYNRVTLTLTTHDEGGLTEKDIAFARHVEGRRGGE